jgi:hypothetical protein
MPSPNLNEFFRISESVLRSACDRLLERLPT